MISPARLMLAKRAIPRLSIAGHRRWMSVRPIVLDKPKLPNDAAAPPPRKKVTLQTLRNLRQSGTPITMLTAYDFPTARASEAHGIDIVLVGDSLAQVCLGYDSTTQLTLDQMIHHSAAVARGCKTPLLVADMPFGSYHVSTEDAIRNAVRLVREGRVEAVKLEGGEEIADVIRRLTSLGIPVMGHVGLLPQRHASSSGYRVHGKTAENAQRVLKAAQAIQDAGAFSIVLEAIPSVIGSYITSKLGIPTIGIGAGPGTSGQVLVWDDVMSTWPGHKAKFVRRFADVSSETARGVEGYIQAVRERSFPDPDVEGYKIDDVEWRRLLELEQNEGWSDASAPPPINTAASSP